MKKKLIGIGVVALALALILTLAPACGNGDEEKTPTPGPGTTPTPGVTPTPTGEVKTLKIGFIGPLSGCIVPVHALGPMHPRPEVYRLHALLTVHARKVKTRSVTTRSRFAGSDIS